MPSLSVDRILFVESLGKDLSDNEIEDLTFDFGVELDEIYEENGRKMLKFDIPANRYDLLCLEGFSTALRAYLNLERFKDVTVVEPTIKVKKYKTHERPFIACAIIKGIKFTKDSYASFISYQSKLHSSIGRNRSLVAIGTHDLSKIKGEVTYQSADLSQVNFIPLQLGNAEKCKMINGMDLEKHFSKDKQISKYFGLLSDKSRAVMFKCGECVMSLPPIINSEATKISPETTDIFVDVTGSDFNKVNTVLKHLLYNFRGKVVEKVKICNAEDNTEISTPVFNNYKYSINIDKVNEKLHLSLSAQQIKDLLERMMYKVDVTDRSISILVPDARSDILHECDILEDIAIAYGFNNFDLKLPEICTVGKETPENKFSDKLRVEMALSGYNEVLTLTLLSRNENIIDSDLAAVLSNPKSKEYEVVRTSLLPGVLKSISSNLHGKIPIKVFEVADVVLLDSTNNEGARNERRLCAVIASNKSLLEDVQGPLSLLLGKCGIKEYKYIAFSDYRYLENQAAMVEVDGKMIGSIGVLHPSICQKFEIPYAASSFELNLDSLFDIFIKLR
ncbi:phenylalanine-tRNA ligase, beta subunit [Vittaforma corneae ATCC 50505]|uniref:phenylalanine--tRNA ligase n=1 Tax=Vittaforma corneae (strain ATCC 50505) TaxID=993615 RepID=L2GN56_VITCO|nr:phenylalanine-tRNA ligase, beta subunit [Vittaforma corneae ATCC 50505]ELA42049.1 phenylalanine-tRNA ligase, beta subunit [Vittaforma corneae ATCC 50505]